ncbi:hypothetical protein DYB32_008472 [Aphanomyces invadans]|uniref:Tc1-like transposase DDE domain-containing protein n=1 Tax=Aphanomyces invadans TaxID=157072 RepID=A0A418AL26_9STRA|nr:hypothetical protein DYB32_008472 [Aphanomyces invadans]
MIYLRGMFILDFDIDDKKAFRSVLRAVQRFLKAQGFKQGKRKRSSTYRLSKANALVRDSYVRQMQPHIHATDRPHIVYTDESFIHDYYKSHHQSLYDPFDDLDQPTKEKHKGRWYSFVAAIFDSPSLNSKVMALDIFTGGKAGGKEPKDYHGMFDNVYYVKRFGRLLDEKGASGVNDALIVLDNAKYHKSLPPSTPTSGSRKSILLQAWYCCLK